MFRTHKASTLRSSILLAAGIAFAIAFTFNACNGHVIDYGFYCIIDDTQTCVIGLTSEQCIEEGYQGHHSYFYTVCPSGYSKVVGSSSSRAVSSSGGSGSSSDGSGGSSSSESNLLLYGGKEYNTVKIGDQIWMAENLNYEVEGSKCYAEGVSGVSADSVAKNCAKYGRLYNWATAMDIDTKYNDEKWGNDVKHQGICPVGWHIPSNEEWKTLISYVESDKGCNSCAGVYLKSTNGWDNCGASGSGKTYLCEDAHSFFALPSGAYSSDSFRYAGIGGRWWSASEFNYSNVSAYCQEMYNNVDFASKNSTGVKSNLFSVRCVKD